MGWQVVRGTPHRAVLSSIAHRSGRRRDLHRAAHSFLPPLALLASRTARPLAVGWSSHLAIDLLTHHSDAWPHLWPLNGWVWRSPLSYWEGGRGGLAFRLAEVAVLAAAACGERRLHRRLIGAAALACAVVPLAWEIGRRSGLRTARRQVA